MDYCKVCKICGHTIKQIPLRRYDCIQMVEMYCPHCDESEVVYETICI
ncbi:MAG: hypothetical protein KKC68_02405 [Candidatus Thermoplasmatota archaeon]|nr:hypothetical protein [Candidatus Thermoplasmatota archaeon]